MAGTAGAVAAGAGAAVARGAVAAAGGAAATVAGTDQLGEIEGHDGDAPFLIYCITFLGPFMPTLDLCNHRSLFCKVYRGSRRIADCDKAPEAGALGPEKRLGPLFETVTTSTLIELKQCECFYAVQWDTELPPPNAHHLDQNPLTKD